VSTKRLSGNPCMKLSAFGKSFVTSPRLSKYFELLGIELKARMIFWKIGINSEYNLSIRNNETNFEIFKELVIKKSTSGPAESTD
jgi:hypothetical protein